MKFRTNRAPIIPEIPADSTPEQKRFFKAIQVLLSENFRSTRQDLDYLNDSIPTLAAYKEKKTYNTKYGFWGDVWYKDADEIIIKPKSINGLSWLAGVFSDGSYVESSTAITAKLAAPGASGHIVDGITAVLASSIYILWLHNNAGTIEPAFTLAPITTFSNANPTNALTLGQINGQDAGFIFPVGSHVVVWQDTNEFETPYFYSIDGGAATVDVTADKPKVSSRTSTVLTLGADLTNATFTAGSTVYQVDNFQPLRLSDGANAFGTDGYLDTGIRILTNASGNIIPFIIIENEFYFCNGSGSADYSYDTGVETYTNTTSYVNYRHACIPPDKAGIILINGGSGGLVTKPYWQTYGEMYYRHTSNATLIKGASYITHGICCNKNVGATENITTRGYII